jgi:transcriptional regulator with XRE-family HTH domain
VKDVLVLLGKRVRDLRAAKKWSQEEFANICGFHRTYAGQVERGEKNISFGNLLKLCNALGVTLSELLSGLEEGAPLERAGARRKPARDQRAGFERRMLEVQRLIKRLGHQRTEMDRTILILEGLMARTGSRAKRPRSARP